MATFASRTSNGPRAPNHVPNPSFNACHQYPAAKSEPATQVHKLDAPS